MSDGEQRDKKTEAEVDVVKGGLAGRLGKVNTIAAKEPVQGVLAIHDEIADWTVEQSHHQSKHQVREIRRKSHESSLVIPAFGSIGRRT